MYEFSPMTDRVQRVRQLYRDTIPFIDTWRYRIVTDFYKENRHLRGNLKRALNFANLCEKLPIWIRDEELIVGAYVETFKASALVTEESMKAIEDLVPLGPLHQPPNIAGIKACQEVMPGKPNVAVFDTAFHQTMPPKAYLYAIPYEYYENDDVRRYGFHGTSHNYVSGRCIDLLGNPEHSKIVCCHLGNGSSLSACVDGKSIDTTMGLSPLAGLPMGTRSGDIDPTILEYLSDRYGYSLKEMIEILNKKSGVLALSEVSSDFRDLEDASWHHGNERAQLALDKFHYEVRKYIGAYAAAMGGVDAIVFTAGVGENGPETREAICSYLEFMGVKLDAEANKCRGKERLISTPDSKVQVWVVPTNEELMIAQDTAELVKAAQ